LARERHSWVCQNCGAVHPRWAGRCEACGGWNTLAEEAPRRVLGQVRPRRRGASGLAFVGLDAAGEPPPRIPTGIGELDRVLGGGLVRGSAVLIGGDPGIGKSTLVLQALAAVAATGPRCVYVSGEESVEQIRLRARRLGLSGAPVELAAAVEVERVLDALEAGPPPAVLALDSIQTAMVEGIEAAPGTVSQIRAAADLLVRWAKRAGTALLLVGHVTKEGAIAGPKLLEHMVDTVLYFEGERGHQYRLLRAVKNRFGATNELGVFEMRDRGLVPVDNPSALFLGDRRLRVPGTCVFAGIEGTRPVLVEVQALVSPSVLASPRRTVVGWDAGRLAMVLAVLETRCGLPVGGRDVYLNVAGGLRVQEPAADLAVAAAIASSLLDVTIPPETVVFGEVGLAGEVRPVAQTEARLKEAEKLGFERALLPRSPRNPPTGLELVPLARLSELVGELGGGRRVPRRAAAREEGMP